MHSPEGKNKNTNTIKQEIHHALALNKSKRQFPSWSARLHLIIQFPVLDTSGNTVDHVIQRQAEYIYSLQQDLLSPHVEAVHILCEKGEDPLFIKGQNLEQDWKLDFNILGRRMRYKDAFEFASKRLIRKNAMVLNADCYVHRGFEKLDESILSRKTMYALTRHESAENIRLCNARDFCGPRSKYIGSHDGFLFRLLAPVSPQLLDKIDYRPNIAGIERVLIFNFRKYGGFTVKNPCKILHIVHHHCSRVRNKTERHIQGRRIDRHLNITVGRQGKLVMAKFSGL
ncbi:uncharacterized protein LOC111323495 [Stylophora pistillata]|uniref:uncharacterized protein LOC111323495 n=1 Tax=Stylophora pistillata TaxID=50429 RepID=UPI000C0545B1|nr:uncharacterized protein LOC111323495 [Stylophora pistillata]